MPWSLSVRVQLETTVLPFYCVAVTETMPLPTYMGMQIHVWGIGLGIKTILHAAAEALNTDYLQTDATGSTGTM